MNASPNHHRARVEYETLIMNDVLHRGEPAFLVYSMDDSASRSEPSVSVCSAESFFQRSGRSSPYSGSIVPSTQATTGSFYGFSDSLDSAYSFGQLSQLSGDSGMMRYMENNSYESSMYGSYDLDDQIPRALHNNSMYRKSDQSSMMHDGREPAYIQLNAFLDKGGMNPFPVGPYVSGADSSTKVSSSVSESYSRYSKESEDAIEESEKFDWGLKPIDSQLLEAKTTLMLRNLPNKYTREMLLEEIADKGLLHMLDFFYLPIDMRHKCNVGYCFLNIADPANLDTFVNAFDNASLKLVKSTKKCIVSEAKLQGLEQNIEAYRNSAVMSMAEKYHPILWVNGHQVPFPAPNMSREEIKVVRPAKKGVSARVLTDRFTKKNRKNGADYRNNQRPTYPLAVEV